MFYIEKIKNIVKNDPHREIVVVSELGKRQADDTKGTDMLIELAKTKDYGLIDRIVDFHRGVFPWISQERIRGPLLSRVSQNLEDRAYLDAVKAWGEETVARITAEEMNAMYIDPREIFLVTDDFGNAKILPESENMIRKRLGSLNGVVVVPGFYGYTKDGLIATFSRGGSDLTGAYIAAALEARVYENFTVPVTGRKEDTHINGVCAADPKIVNNPMKIEEITYSELRDLSYSGFDIMHSEALKPVAAKNIRMHVRNTLTYPHRGTFIVGDRVSNPKMPIVGIAYQDGFCAFSISKIGLDDETGIDEKILGAFVLKDESGKERRIPVNFTPGAVDDISVVMREKHPLVRAGWVDEIKTNLYKVVGDDGLVDFIENLGCLVVAGKGLREALGIAAGIQSTLDRARIDTVFTSIGAQKRCFVYGVNPLDGNKAVNALYDEFIRPFQTEQ